MSRFTVTAEQRVFRPIASAFAGWPLCFLQVRTEPGSLPEAGIVTSLTQILNRPSLARRTPLPAFRLAFGSFCYLPLSWCHFATLQSVRGRFCPVFTPALGSALAPLLGDSVKALRPPCRLGPLVDRVSVWVWRSSPPRPAWGPGPLSAQPAHPLAPGHGISETGGAVPVPVSLQPQCRVVPAEMEVFPDLSISLPA